MKLLHLDSSPRSGDSISRQLSRYLADRLDAASVIHRDLAPGFPHLAAEDLVAIHGSRNEGTFELEKHQQISATLIDELFAADTLVIGVAMHNFSVPAVLKRWIDYVARAGVTFRYSESGPEGLTGIRNAYLVIASGGTAIGGEMDFASGYLTHICRFLGIDNVHVIDAGGSKREADAILSGARQRIDQLIDTQKAA